MAGQKLRFKQHNRLCIKPRSISTLAVIFTTTNMNINPNVFTENFNLHFHETVTLCILYLGTCASKMYHHILQKGFNIIRISTEIKLYNVCQFYIHYYTYIPVCILHSFYKITKYGIPMFAIQLLLKRWQSISNFIFKI